MKTTRHNIKQLSPHAIRTAIALFLVSGFQLEARETNITMRFGEKWSNVFAGQTITSTLIVNSVTPIKGRLVWRFSAAGRTLQRGERSLSITPGGAPQPVSMQIKTPHIKEGVIMKTALEASIQEEGKEKPTASVSRTIWVFPDTPFSNKKKWLKELNIHLFDPEEKTAGVFKEMEIPYTPAPNIEAFSSVEDGILIIGEKISFRDYRGLAEAMIKSADSGINVLCLCPAESEFRFPNDQQETLPAPDRTLLSGNDIIRELDKRLDSETWKPGCPAAPRGFKLEGERNGIKVVVGKREKQSVFMELGFGESRLVICGFGIVEHWVKSPTPRFLLDRLLDYVEKKNKK